MKTCGKCNVQKPFTEFHRKGDGWKSYCIPCARETSRQHYAANKQVYRDRAKRHRDDTRRANREYVQSLKSSTPCKDCDKKYPYYVMQFDHVRQDKEHNIADMMQLPRRRLEEEIDKCELVCANCHAERTYQRRNADLA